MKINIKKKGKNMAKIFKTNQQEEALKSIVENLKNVEIINKLLENENIENCKLRLMGNIDDIKINEQFDLPYSLLTPTLKDYRKSIVKDTFDKSKKFHIELEEKEIDILNNKKEEKKEAIVKDEQVINNFDNQENDFQDFNQY